MKSTHKQTQSCCQGYLKGTRQAGSQVWRSFRLGFLGLALAFCQSTLHNIKRTPTRPAATRCFPNTNTFSAFLSFLSALRGHINIIFSGNLFMAFLSPQRASAQLLERDCQNSSTWHTFPTLTFHTVSVSVSVPLLVCFPCNLYVCNIYIYAYMVDFTNVFGLFALDAFSRPSDCLKSSPPTE